MYSSAVPSSPPPQWNPGNAPILERTRTPTSPPPTSPTSPTRPGRLRGLSYLRNYTQNHILSRDNHSGSSSHQRPSTVRASSYPSPTSSRPSPAPQNTIPPQTSAPVQRTTSEVPSARISNQETPGNTSGWLPATASSSVVLSGNGPSVAASDLTASMVRTRFATMGGAAELPQGEGVEPAHQVNGTNGPQGMAHQLPSIRFSAHQDPRAQRPSLVFSPMSRILPTGSEIIKVGRYSERDNQPVQAVNVPSAAPVGFKSKVVSRRHCEFWCAGGRWFIKDVKSSSGTFLNHIRLSSPATESRPFPVNDGDIVQLGIDFKGGEEMIFRCVKIRVELNKGWQTGPSSFNVQSHKRLRELNSLGKPPAGGTSSQDCSICLGPIAPCQSLFVAPCSHTWHYKCIRVIINGPHWPHFICPNCRTVADLEAELDDPYANGEWEELDAAGIEGAAEQAPSEAAAANTTARPERPKDTDEIRAAAEADGGASIRSHHDSSNGEIVDEKDGSGHDHAVGQAAEILGYLNLEEGSPSPAESVDSHPAQASNATVAPVDIIARKPVPSASNSASRLEQPESRLDRTVTRTPSPNGLGSSLAAEAGVEGPMTPRNDAGPFIFDGSAGRPSDLRLASMATMNLNAAANTPPHVEGETA